MSQSTQASTPSPVRALDLDDASRRVHLGHVVEEQVEVEVEERQEVDLVDYDEVDRTEHHRVLERLLLALGDGVDHGLRVLADVELRRAHQVSDVLDDDEIQVVER